MSFRSKFVVVVMSATLALYAVVGGLIGTNAQSSRRNDPGEQLRIFQGVLYHIQNDYVDEPDLNRVRSGALRGLAYGLDPYSTYLTADQVRAYRAGATPNNASIGTELSQLASYLYVIAPVKGGPAAQAGVRAGDIIEYIDQKATRDISLYDAQQLLNGAAGTEVKLRILRPGPRSETITVRRSAVTVPAAESRLESDRTGIIRLNSLADGEADAVRTRLRDLQKQGATKIVLDLRSVAGGSLDEAVRVANLFIREGTLAQTIGKKGQVLKTLTAKPDAAIFTGAVVALIDRSTAGAAEAVAAAIKERKRGEVVGVNSFGAGTNQELFTLRGGDGLLLTTVKWASPDGKAFLGEGVAPTVEVKLADNSDGIDPEELTGNDTDDVAQPSNDARPSATPEAPAQPAEDIQLKKALEVLRAQNTKARAA